ncbi:MAG TPA: helix-turn-helix transcriptional regulator [Actinomycetes bacterium]|jgi:transcriptional regulator|nr:helix-turn-helix transcriptional regulator [Actinomycetes bacterium]
MNGQVLKGHLDLLLLAAVSGGPAHGYAIVEQLRERSGGTFDLAEGTVYPALHRLERAGLLGSRWSTAGGRRRRVYQLTGRGRAALQAQEREWRRFSSAVAAVLDGG